MAEVVIRAEGLGKSYRLGARGAAYRTLREALAGLPGAARRGRSADPAPGLLWALRDASFEVREGEVLAVIGRNGAGKSTLLKLLSRITEPSAGRVAIHGRVGSLLEVGTGFHPELTGRENVYLNGSILGMRRAEIDRKFDEIVAFAEVERFLDTPVKRYSSGMHMRLAFAVAAHLEPEILLVDEVLAVGDAAFQKKCLGKMEAVAHGGRTVLLVSHNMGLVGGLAGRGIVLEAGRVAMDCGIREAVRGYLETLEASGACDVALRDHPNRVPGMRQVFTGVTVGLAGGAPSGRFLQSDDILLEVAYDGGAGPPLAGAGFILHTAEGLRVGSFNTYMTAPPPHRLPARGRVRFTLPARQLAPGDYRVTISVGAHPGALEDKVEHAVGFEVAPADIYGTGYLLTREDGVCSLVGTSAVVPAADARPE